MSHAAIGRQPQSCRVWRRAKSVLPLVLVDLSGPLILAGLHPRTPLPTVALAVGIVSVYRWARLYRSRLHRSVLDELPCLLLGILVGSALAGFVLLMRNRAATAEVLQALLLTTVLILVGRSILYRHPRAIARHGHWQHPRVLVVGTGAVGQEVAHRFRHRTSPGLVLAGLVGDPRNLDDDARALWQGNYQDYGELVHDLEIDVVVCAFPQLQEWELARLLRRHTPLDVEVYTVPAGYTLRRWGGPWADRVWGMPIIPVAPAAMAPTDRFFKRLFDVVLALVSLILLAPVMALVALAVRYELGPGVIFRQERIGKGGRPFVMYKFRSMHPVRDGDSQTRWSIAGDKNIGPVGRFIRSTSLDELPQLVNILRGEMSFVGPRPERPYFVQQYSSLYPDYADRHRVPAGLTGYAAIQGLRGDTDIAERARFDNWYIDNWSMWQDAKIIVRTLSSVFQRHGS